MHWKIRLNTPCIIVWRRLFAGWLAFVGFALLAGAHLNPRPDEIMFAVTLPLWLGALPYALYSLAVVVLRSFGPIRFHRLIRLPLFGRHKRLRQDTSPQPHRRKSNGIPGL